MERRITIRIRELRRASALTQEELADALGLSRQSVNALEAGRCLPSLPVALQIAAYFGVPLHSIFAVDEAPQVQPLTLRVTDDQGTVAFQTPETNELSVWSPLEAMLNGLMDERAAEQQISNLPAVNISETTTDIQVEMRLPGFRREDLELEVGDDFLTVRGERREERRSDHTVLRREFTTQDFTRTVGLPAAVTSDKASAEMNHGLLTVILPKRLEPKPKTTRLTIEDK